MLFISHRGNTEGRKIEFENSPDYIDHALELGYEVEIDIWFIDGAFFLGHDSPSFQINWEWIESRVSNLWLHCKNIGAIEILSRLFKVNKELNFFWHENDVLTITSLNYLWVYPGKQLVLESIAVLPELNNESVTGCAGVCSDFIKFYRYENI